MHCGYTIVQLPHCHNKCVNNHNYLGILFFTEYMYESSALCWKFDIWVYRPGSSRTATAVSQFVWQVAFFLAFRQQLREHNQSSSAGLFCNNVVMLTELRVGWRLLLLLNCQRVSALSTNQTWSNQDQTFIPHKQTGLGLIQVSFHPHSGGSCIQMLEGWAIT